VQLVAFGVNLRRQCGDDLARYQRGIGGGRNAGQYDDELVAAQAGDEIGFAHDLGQAAGDLAQQVIANLVAERVVDDLEAVEVEEHDRHLPLVAACLGQQLGKAHEQGEAVGQAGQCIVLGDVAHALFGFAALGDVGQNPDVMRRLPALRVIYPADPDAGRKQIAGFRGELQLAVP